MLKPCSSCNYYRQAKAWRKINFAYKNQILLLQPNRCYIAI